MEHKIKCYILPTYSTVHEIYITYSLYVLIKSENTGAGSGGDSSADDDSDDDDDRVQPDQKHDEVRSNTILNSVQLEEVFGHS